MYRAVFIFAVLLLFALPASAQTITHTLSGVVVRSDARTPIENAAVAAGGIAVVTDKDGRFTLTLPAAKLGVEVTSEGYFLLTATVDLTERDVTDVQFALAPSTTFNSTVTVVGSAPTLSPAATPVAPVDVLKTAGALDNVFRTLQTLPGVAATEEFSSRMTVRGGAPDQNLTVMDGVEVHDPYRLFGLTSAFNPEVIRRFELATGGFSAKYGDRLSSLLVIENRDGDGSRRLGGSAALSITDANLVFEGKLPKTARGSWLVTARRTYYDLVAARIANQDFPGFTDLQAKGTWESKAGRKLTVFGLGSRESAAVTFDDNTERAAFNDDTKNDLAWIRLDSPLGARGHSMTVAGYSRSRSAFGVSALFENKNQRSNAPTNVAFGVTEFEFSRELDVRDGSLRQEFLWSLGAHTLELGGEWHQLTTGLNFLINGDRNPAAANGSSQQGGAGLPDALDSRLDANRGGAWLIDTWRVGARIGLEGGLRFDRAGINHEMTLSPRLSTSVTLTKSLSVHAAAGLYTQSPGYEKAVQSDYVLNFSADTAASLKSERARLVSLGVERVIGRGVAIRAETYYKQLTDMLIGRLETDAERIERLSHYDYPRALASEIPTDAIITTVPTNDGRGSSYGFDVLLSRMTAPVNAAVRGWASYTWGHAITDAYDRAYPFEYDRRQAITAVLSYRVSRKWELASTVRWATGFPRTPPLGVRAAGAEDTADQDHDGITDEIRPLIDKTGRQVYEVNYGGVTNLNTSRLPDFARVDVRVTWKPRGVAGRWEFYAEVINLMNRKNAGAFQAVLAYDPTSDRPRIIEQPDQSIPRLPTIGVRWRF